MCGIAGILAYTPEAPAIDRVELRRIRDRMAPRGPDGQGEWYSADGRVGFGHRRLAIIDLSDAGAQPMTSADGQRVITFNGEIYNYRELRSQLEAQGYRFRTQSDTEVLLNLYAAKGADLVDDLRGMYAFAIWDARARSLLLARDPYAIKPLYLADDGYALRFASQVKALLAGGSVDTRPEPAGHAGFFLWGHVPEPHTLYRGIRALPAGSTLWLDAHGTRRVRTFWSINRVFRAAEAQPLVASSSECLAMVREALRDTVRSHLVADVPVGAFLSAGLDSTTLAALATEQGVARLRTVTLSFQEYQGTANDEAPLAEHVARQLGAEHQTRRIAREDFLAEREHLLDAMDQPTLDGVNTYFVSKATREAGLKVALSGLGGDEIVGGYSSFQQIPLAVARLRWPAAVPGLGRATRHVLGPALALSGLQRRFSPKYAGLLEYGGSFAGAYLLQRALLMPWELSKVLDPDLAKQGWQDLQAMDRLNQSIEGLRNPHLQVSALTSSHYLRNQLLRDSDWASMAHGLELRVPLVDHRLLETLAPLYAAGHGPGKQDMARAPRDPLPEAVMERPKTGFSIPVQDWLLADRPSSQVAPSYRDWARYLHARFMS